MNSDLFKSWRVLFGLQTLAAVLIFSEFLSGRFYFAYLDIGSDSYFLWVPQAMHLARTMSREGFTGWSFQLGLGGPTAIIFGDLCSLLIQLVGTERILPTRIFFYLLKIALGGAFFLMFIRHYVQRWQSAVMTALAFSFCGYMVINGQWDTEATAFVFYPLVLWAIVRHLQKGDWLALPIVIATTLVFGTFFVSLSVFLAFACAAFVVCSDAPVKTLKSCVLRVLPLSVLGYLLAAPYLMPVIFQLMDSSRVGGGQSLIHGILRKSLGITDWPLLVAQIGGIFHKDIFGIGSNYKGYFNYLEGPGFFIGITPFLLIPQLWAGTRADRRALALTATAFAAYLLFPVFRYAAMGFAAPYFRISTLWVSMLGLILAARALDLIFSQGIKIRLLAIGLAVFGVLLAIAVLCATDGTVSMPHVEKIGTLAALSTALLMLAHRKLVKPDRLPIALMLVVVVEIVAIARPSYVDGRAMVGPALNAYDDKTPEALAAIKKLDSGSFRIEKDYNSVSLADAMAQDYMGIKSYSLHSRGVVDFHIGSRLIPPSSPVVNYSNWLPNAGPRYMLNSLLGVKYYVAVDAIDWPGFVEAGDASGLRIYRNEMALPFGFVQTKQVNRLAFDKFIEDNAANAIILTDTVLINAVVVDNNLPGYGSSLKIDALAQSRSLSLEAQYIAPVALLQKTGLKLDYFSSNHITGSIAPTEPGVLVFSIPFNAGWTLKLDGQTTSLFRANFGMLAATVGVGHHSVELNFETPGRTTGWLFGALGLCTLVLAGGFSRRAAKAQRTRSV